MIENLEAVLQLREVFNGYLDGRYTITELIFHLLEFDRQDKQARNRLTVQAALEDMEK